MASNTNNLGLLKKDPVADGNDTFNVRTMLNENWDKIDEFAGKTTPISKGGTGATTAAQALSNLGAAAVSAVGNLHVWKRVQSGVTDYLTSTDRNAYTDGTVGNTTITYLGQLGGGARIEVGSYVGTGTYGSSNPNSLTFGFKPKFVLLMASTGTGGNYVLCLHMVYGAGFASVYDDDGNDLGCIVTWGDKSVTWYSGDSANVQLNSSGERTYYIAIG